MIEQKCIFQIALNKTIIEKNEVNEKEKEKLKETLEKVEKELKQYK